MSALEQMRRLATNNTNDLLARVVAEVESLVESSAAALHAEVERGNALAVRVVELETIIRAAYGRARGVEIHRDPLENLVKEVERLAEEKGQWASDHDAEHDRAEALAARVAELEARINTPEIFDFIEGMKAEAAHQRERWAATDGGKTDADWFWLVGYLSGKALHKPDKRLHHLITAAAALFNWHLATVGKTDMRPGIATPEGVSTEVA